MKRHFSDLTFDAMSREGISGYDVELLPDRMVITWRSLFQQKRLDIPWRDTKIVSANSVGLNHPKFDQHGITVYWMHGAPGRLPNSIYFQHPPGSDFYLEVQRLVAGAAAKRD